MLLYIVFVTGASILIVEVLAVRILSPYYGSTIYTVSSVIGVILAGLSFGYYIGGRFADSHPSLQWFFGIILAGGSSLLLLSGVIIYLLPVLGYNFSVIWGPLIWSMILFFFPSFLLGTLSPFVIKLQEQRLEGVGIGRISGEVFFWSTLGSIIGSLVAGFVLIPQFGIKEIMVSVALLLVVLGGVGLLITGKGKQSETARFGVIIGIVLITAVAASFLTIEQNSKILYTEDGVYHRVTIFEDEYKGKRARFLTLDRNFSGVMLIDSDELAVDYTKYYKVYEALHPGMQEILVIGGGAYTVPTALLEEVPDIHIDTVEIDPSLFGLAKIFFRVPDDSRLQNFTEDGRRFLYDVDKKYDLIFSDAYHTLYSIPTHLVTKEFFQLAKEKLNDNGIFLANVIGTLSPEHSSLLFSEIKTFRSVFPNSYFFALTSPESKEFQNIVFLGLLDNKEVDIDVLAQTVMKEGKNAIPHDIRDKLIDVERVDFSSYIELTDNFAPVEYLGAKALGAL